MRLLVTLVLESFILTQLYPNEADFSNTLQIASLFEPFSCGLKGYKPNSDLQYLDQSMPPGLLESKSDIIPLTLRTGILHLAMQAGNRGQGH